MVATFIIDQGSAFTKGFLFSEDLKLLKKSLCPTTPIPQDGVDWVLASLGRSKEKVVVLNKKEDSDASALLKLFSNFYHKKFFRLDFGASAYKTAIPSEKILPYILEIIQGNEIENYIGNKRIKPWKIPHNKKELQIEFSYFLNSVSFKPNSSAGVILSGGIFRNKIGAYEILLILNLLRNSPLTEVFIDKEVVSLAWGAFLTGAELEDKSKLELGGIEKLGTIIALNGSGKVTFDFGLNQLQETAVGKDEIIVVPSKEDQTVKVSFSHGREEIKETIITGGLGIIIDGREDGSFSERSKTGKWLTYLGDLSIID